jgi:integrase
MPQKLSRRISKRAVDALSCPKGKDRTFLWDGDLAGFGVVAFPSGRKVFVAQFRQHGRSRRMALGDYGRLTPDEARSEAKKVLGAVETGENPLDARQAERHVRTFAEVAEEFLSQHVDAKRKSRTAQEYRKILRRHLLPKLGTKRLLDITRADIRRLHSSLADRPFIANRCLALISAIWNWAAKREEVPFEANPAQRIERNKENRRERFLSTEEISRIGDALHLAETKGLPFKKSASKHAKPGQRRILDPYAVAAIRLLLLTGARKNEILCARWEYVDFERSMLLLPDSKTGRKTIYLSAPALAVLSELPRIEGNPFVIAGEKDTAHRVDLKNPWEAICEVAKLKGVRLNDLRHTFASFGAGASLGLPIIGKLLGHSQAQTTARYAHLAAGPMFQAVDAIGAQISGAMTGKTAEVVPLHKKR